MQAYCLFIQQVSAVVKCKMNIIMSLGHSLLTLCIDSGFVALNSKCKSDAESTNFHPSSQRTEL